MKKTIEKLGSRGRIVIPKDIREAEQLDENDFVRLTVEKADMGESPEEARENIEKQGRKKTARDRTRYNVFGG